MAIQNVDEILNYCYRRLFYSATPSADYDVLITTALPNQYGRKVIDGSPYQIDEEKYDSIIAETIKKFKIKQKKYQEGLKYCVRFGSRPTIINHSR